jgi:hypothetical protein
VQAARPMVQAAGSFANVQHASPGANDHGT